MNVRRLAWIVKFKYDYIYANETANTHPLMSGFLCFSVFLFLCLTVFDCISPYFPETRFFCKKFTVRGAYHHSILTILIILRALVNCKTLNNRSWLSSIVNSWSACMYNENITKTYLKYNFVNCNAPPGPGPPSHIWLPAPGAPGRRRPRQHRLKFIIFGVI